MNEARQTLIKNWDQRKVSRATVLVAGAGAIGSQTAVTLARIGVGTIIAVDSDSLEKHNVYNQIYRKDQIWKSKVDALREIIGEISGCEFIGIKSKIQNVQVRRLEPDILLGCLDNAGARFFMNYVSVSLKIPYIDAGIESYAGSVRSVLPQESPCLQCWPILIKTNEVKAGCSRDPIPSTYFTASYASGIQVMQLVNHLFGKGIHPMICFDLEKGVTRPVELKRNGRCGLCSTPAES
jgi:adenylyltransferase/sulfurtransferase